MCETNLRAILIKCSANLQSLYKAPSSWFSTFGSVVAGKEFRESWASSTAYSTQDVIERLGKAYVAKQDSLNQDPVLDVSATYWEETTLYLKIILQPNEWVRQRQGEPSQYRRGYRSVTRDIKPQNIGFTCTISEDYLLLRYLLEEIIALSDSSALETHVPVTLIDFMRPEREDFKAARQNNTEPYTIRYGSITMEDETSSSGYLTELYGEGGFRFTFIEKDLRLV